LVRSRGFAAIRLAELERLFEHRYGGPVFPQDDAGTEDSYIMANTLAHLSEPEVRLAAFFEQWTPWMDKTKRALMSAQILASPRKWTADALGERFKLTNDERFWLGITTIGVEGETKEMRIAARNERKRLAAEKRRREAGAVPQAIRSANSITKARPWIRANISRATWYRLQKIASGEIETIAWTA
jgi:hypothetical protein